METRCPAWTKPLSRPQRHDRPARCPRRRRSHHLRLPGQRLRQPDRAHRPVAGDPSARRFDTAIAAQLAFRRSQGLNLQDEVLETCQLFRVGHARPPTPLAPAGPHGPGDLMTNTPLDFLTNDLDVRFDLLYLLPGRPLPPVIPDHDVAFFAQGEADPATLSRLRALFAAGHAPP